MEQKFQNQGLLNLVNKLNEDPTLMEKFSVLKEPTLDSIYEIALTISDGYTKEEFVEFMKYLNEVREKVEASGDISSLSYADLKNISGGSSFSYRFGKALLGISDIIDGGLGNMIKFLGSC